jgi:hypothetical protein
MTIDRPSNGTPLYCFIAYGKETNVDAGSPTAEKFHEVYLDGIKTALKHNISCTERSA